MRRETMHVSHVGTSRMRQYLRKAGFDMSRPLVTAHYALENQMDLKTVTTVDTCSAARDTLVFLQAA